MVESGYSGVQLSIFQCQWCSQPLPKGRADMRTHKACRPKLWRWKKKQERLTKEAVKIINEIGQSGLFDFQRMEAIEQLKQINEALAKAYILNNMRRVL